MNARRLRTLPAMAASIATLSGAATVSADPVTFNTRGTHTKETSWTWPIPAAAMGPWQGTVFSWARADGVDGPPPYTVQGTKLSFTPAPFRFLPGTVTNTNTAIGPRGSSAVGTTTLNGSAGLSTFNGFYGKAEVSHTGVIAPARRNGTAKYVGDAWDPWPFGEGGIEFNGADRELALGLTCTNETPLNAGADWNASYSAFVRDISTFDDEVFFSQPAQLLYDVRFGADSDGVPFAHVQFGQPSGFALSFDRTVEEAQGLVLQALTSGAMLDLNVLNARLDLSGHTSATIGYADHFDVDRSKIPGPGPVALLVAAAVVSPRRKR